MKTMGLLFLGGLPGGSSWGAPLLLGRPEEHLKLKYRQVKYEDNGVIVPWGSSWGALLLLGRPEEHLKLKYR